MEVTMSIGIVSFAVLTVVGLLPTGMNSLSQSRNQTVEAQILRSVGASVWMGNFDGYPVTKYFDREGQLLRDAEDYHFVVNIEADAPRFPGVGNALGAGTSMKRLRVTVDTEPVPGVVSRRSEFALQVANPGR